ncbi:signal peptidase II [Ignavigranum ruoffiae]|uniref:Lipoprotein signal peptidase n=1 Tax=Ignavigranum ruoffiae TaxID=89093 RepID=A0A1H8ZH97_9LACT|nr:signal peptidase II [Ignavigranum ruoffiae]SEP63721.1 signal peptidase II [Ignavigranum ruoffiae]
MIFSLFWIVFIVFCDQIFKFWLISTLDLYQSAPLIPGLIQLTYVQNKGAAWSLLTGKVNFLMIIAVLAIAYFSWQLYQARQASKGLRLIYALIIAGALGNLIDRFVYGYVIDMFDLMFIQFPIFNLADIAICIGMVLLFGHLYLYEEGGQ